MAVKWGILSTADINRKLLAGAAESDDVDVVAVGSRDLARAEEFAQSGGSNAPTAATRSCSPTRRSRPSTSRCRTRCTASGRSRSLEAGKHVLCEKPFSRTSRTSSGPSTPPRRRACTSRRRSCTGTTRRRPASRSSSRTGAIGELRVIRAVVQLLALRRRQHPAAAGRRGRRADGRRLLLRQRRPPARWRARVRRRGRAHRLERDRLGLHGADAVPE